MSIDGTQHAPLHSAVQEGDAARVHKLLRQGSDVNKFDELSMTSLHYAARLENIEIARILLEASADPNAREQAKIGNTPLGEIAARCTLEMAELLVDAGANPTIPGWMQLTALHHAKARKSPEGRRVYALLLDCAKAKFQYDR